MASTAGTTPPADSAGAEGEQLSLRRDVTVWGSYMWGYADVGADIYVALGIVMAAAQGWANIAFAAAGLVYVMIGLAYTELAATYPVSGGGQYFALRGLGDFWGYCCGIALLLSYTIDIALFSVASSGYLNSLLNFIFGFNLTSKTFTIGPLEQVAIWWMVEAVALIAFLIWLNIRGIKESSLLNEVLGSVDIVLECSIVAFGFLFAWQPSMLIHQMQNVQPSWREFAFGYSLAIISFVGLESISQAAQETRRPATIIPRTSIALVLTVFVFAVAFSNVTLGILPIAEIAERKEDPVAFLASNIPVIAAFAGPFAAFLGATVLLISSNSGVMSASRLVFSMSQLQVAPKWFDKVHPVFRTPARTIIVFSGIGMIQAVFAFSFRQSDTLDTLANVYAFGASSGYLIVFASLIRLRFADPYSPRPYKMPFNIPIWRNGQKYDFPILGIVGAIGVTSILVMVVATHPVGRIVGPIWVSLLLAGYLYWRKSKGLPMWGSLKRNWQEDQERILTEAEEFEMLEAYRLAIAKKDAAQQSEGMV